MICVDQKSGIRSSEPLQTLLAVRGSKVRYTCWWYEFEIEEIMREGRKKRVRVWTIMPYKADSLIWHKKFYSSVSLVHTCTSFIY